MSEIIFEIEEKRNEIQRVLSSPLSCYKKISLLSDFFSLLLSTNNKNILQAYSTGLIAPFSNYLATCDVACVPPEKHNRIIATTEAILASQAFPDAADTLQQSLTSFNEKVKELTAVLNGEDGFVLERNNYLFPLLDTTSSNGDLFGMLDSITIKILKGKEETFHLIPSEKEIETRIKAQIETSWNVAAAYARKYIKHISPHHEVIVSFDKRVGFYVGDSLGVALTLAYINELFLYYNAPLTITAKEGSCFTGSLLQNGEIPSIGDENITKKVELVFYAGVKTFVLPKADEPAAEKKLRELKKEYSNRNLKLIAVTDLEDLLSRRNVVNIKRLSLLKRTGKTIARNKIITALAITVISMLSFFYFYEYDDNPYGYEATPAGFNIVNQSGRVLWTIKSTLSSLVLKDSKELETRIRVLDLNGDKKNEVIYCFDSNDATADKNLSDGVAFYDYKGQVFNKLAFTKTVYSKRETLAPPYGWILHDTLTFKNSKSIIAAVNNVNSYASATFIIDLKTQKIISDTLWNCGHILDIRITTINDERGKFIIGLAINNGYKSSSLFQLEISKFGGQIPSTDNYQLYNIKQAEVKNMFIFLKSDYASYYHLPNAGLNKRSLDIGSNFRSVRFFEKQLAIEKPDGIIYTWDSKSNNFLIAIESYFRVNRDSLVAQGKLQKPYTDTWEYRQLLHDQILRWDGKEFIPLGK